MYFGSHMQTAYYFAKMQCVNGQKLNVNIFIHIFTKLSQNIYIDVFIQFLALEVIKLRVLNCSFTKT